MLIVSVVVLALFLTACGGQDGEGENGIELGTVDRSLYGEDEVLLTYDSGQVTGKEFLDFLSFYLLFSPDQPTIEQEVHAEWIDTLVMEKLIREEMLGEDVSWAEEQTEELWAMLVDFYGEEELDKAFERLELNEELVKERMLESFISTQYFRARIPEEERTIASVRHILVRIHDEDDELEEGVEPRSEEEADVIVQDILEQLEEGADFAELAEMYTEDEGSATNGGLYEDAYVTGWVPEFKQAALEQEIGVIGQPVRTQFGYHIVLVEDRTVLSVDEMDPNRAGQLIEMKYMEYMSLTVPEHIQDKNI